MIPRDEGSRIKKDGTLDVSEGKREYNIQEPRDGSIPRALIFRHG
jgi:hypothetical protein